MTKIMIQESSHKNCRRNIKRLLQTLSYKLSILQYHEDCPKLNVTQYNSNMELIREQLDIIRQGVFTLSNDKSKLDIRTTDKRIISN